MPARDSEKRSSTIILLLQQGLRAVPQPKYNFNESGTIFALRYLTSIIIIRIFPWNDKMKSCRILFITGQEILKETVMGRMVTLELYHR